MTGDQYNRFNKFKILAHSDKIEKIVTGKIPAPVEWVIYPSNICGYACGHCIMMREQEDHRAILSQKAMERIPYDVAENDIKCVIFSGGGDPLLNPMTDKIAGKLKKMGVLVGLNTQGYIAADVPSYNFIRYSVDAATPDTYQAIHRVPRADGWKRVGENVKAHAQMKTDGVDTELGLAFLITPINSHEAYQFCEWASEFNPDFIHIRPAYLDADYLDREYPGGGVKIKNEIMPSLREVAKKIAVDFPNAYFTAEKFEGFWTKKKYPRCRATPLMAVTSGDGAFLVCQDRGISAQENHLRWGNYNEQSFKDLWYSNEHQKIIEAIDLDKCPRCVMNGYNEIIEHAFVRDGMKMALI